MEREDHGHICFAFVFAYTCARQNPKTPNLSPWLTTPLHMAGYEVWDLPRMSVAPYHTEVIDVTSLSRHLVGTKSVGAKITPLAHN